MSDEPVVREREPIERVRARLEALVRANAAPRCGARSKRTGKPCRAAANAWDLRIHVRPARSILSNALNLRWSPIAALVRSP